jgi:hypothetical protein
MNRAAAVSRSLALAAFLAAPVWAGSRTVYSSSYRPSSSYYQHKPNQGGAGATGGTSSGSGGVASIPYNAGWDYNSGSARRQFQKKTGFPAGRPGYVVDYIVPLSRGGVDSPKNMRWVPVEQALR